MSERGDDGPIAPRRTLEGGPVLPPPSAEQDEERRRAAQAQAAKEAREEQRRAQKEAAQREREAKAEERRRAKAAKQEARHQAPARPASPQATPAAKPRPRTRKARLRLTQIDAWSVMKTSFLLSIALGIVVVVAVAIVWAVLGAAGVWDSINSIVQQAVGSQDGPQFDVTDYVGTSRVLGFTLIVAVVDVILITAIATLGAFLYNLSAALLGGIEVTLAEDS